MVQTRLMARGLVLGFTVQSAQTIPPLILRAVEHWSCMRGVIVGSFAKC